MGHMVRETRYGVRRSWLVGGLAVAAGVAGIVGVNLAEADSSVQLSAAQPEGVPTPATGQPDDPGIAHVGCSTNVEALIAGSDDPMNRRRGVYPPSQRSDPAVQPLSSAQAEEAARVGHRGSPAAPVSAAVSAREMPYQAFAAAAGFSPDALIHPTRCVWVVSVQAPFIVPTPYGVGPITHDSYSVVLDAGSGTRISVGAPSFAARGVAELP